MSERSGQRLDVRKTYKLYIGGAFPRSESGRSYEVNDAQGRFLANASQASRKDARDAVVAARKASRAGRAAPPTTAARCSTGWPSCSRAGGRSSSRRSRRGEGLSARKADAAVDAAIDRWVWYAGWADKVTQVVGNANPVAGPYFNLSTPEPTGVVASVAPQDSSLLGLVSVLAPAIVTGNTVVVLAAERVPLPAITLGEVLATSDVPGGVVNLLTGRVAEVAPWLASHLDVNALDLTGVGDDDLARELEVGSGREPQARTPSPPPRTGSPTRGSAGWAGAWRSRRSGTRSASEPPRPLG